MLSHASHWFITGSLCRESSEEQAREAIIRSGGQRPRLSGPIIFEASPLHRRGGWPLVATIGIRHRTREKPRQRKRGSVRNRVVINLALPAMRERRGPERRRVGPLSLCDGCEAQMFGGNEQVWKERPEFGRHHHLAADGARL
jgi:hypothetical protein